MSPSNHKLSLANGKTKVVHANNVKKANSRPNQLKHCVTNRRTKIKPTVKSTDSEDSWSDSEPSDLMQPRLFMPVGQNNTHEDLIENAEPQPHVGHSEEPRTPHQECRRRPTQDCEEEPNEATGPTLRPRARIDHRKMAKPPYLDEL